MLLITAAARHPDQPAAPYTDSGASIGQQDRVAALSSSLRPQAQRSGSRFEKEQVRVAQVMPERALPEHKRNKRRGGFAGEATVLRVVTSEQITVRQKRYRPELVVEVHIVHLEKSACHTVSFGPADGKRLCIIGYGNALIALSASASFTACIRLLLDVEAI